MVSDANVFGACDRLVKSFRTTPYALHNMLSWDGRDDQNRMLGGCVHFVELNAVGYTETQTILFIR